MPEHQDDSVATLPAGIQPGPDQPAADPFSLTAWQHSDTPIILANFGNPWVGMFNRSPRFVYVISNGAINLSPKQPCVFQEILRVLKPNGRLYLADMIRLDPSASLSCHSESKTGSWANCVAGTLSRACLEKLMADAGFQDVTFIKTTGYHTSPETEGALFRATKPAN